MSTKTDDKVLSGIHNANLSHILHPVTLRHLAREWLKEDTPNFDYGGFVVGEKEETAVLLMKSPGVLAGRPFFDAIFKELECVVTWNNVLEGSFIEPIKHIATVSGKVRQILLGERVALNIICRASGIATLAHKLRKLVDKAGWKGEIAGTRKTTPGFRLVEKYSLLVGGISTHRYDLSSMIMLKDNHIWTAGSISQAVKDAKVVGGFSLKVETECRSVEDAEEAAIAGSDVVMLDNFAPEALDKAAKALKDKFPNLIIEASGGITEANLTDYCSENVNVISLSRLTQGYDVVDFSLKIHKDGIDPRNLPAVKDAKVVGGFSLKVETECRSVEDAEEAAIAGSDVVMLDNFAPEALDKAAKALKDKFPNLIIEASGGITEANLTSYCSENVNVISLSRLTQGYDVVDFSLKIHKDGIDPRNLPVKL